jgi:hypothetical protein
VKTYTVILTNAPTTSDYEGVVDLEFIDAQRVVAVPDSFAAAQIAKYSEQLYFTLELDDAQYDERLSELGDERYPAGHDAW